MMEVFSNPHHWDSDETCDLVPGPDASNVAYAQYDRLPHVLRAGDGSKIMCLTILHKKSNSVVRLVDHEAFHTPLLGKFYSGDVSEERVIQRFRNEADILTMFRGKNVPYVRGSGEYEGRPYILMDVIPGVSLQAISDAAEGRPLPRRAIKCIGAGLACTLASIHEAGVVHRDIKPGNAILRDDGGVSIIDFGLACRRRGDELRLTFEGQAMGTPRYLAPESFVAGSRDATPASDIYGLGLMLTELSMGKHPMSDDQVYALRVQHLRAEDYSAVCLRATQEIAKQDRQWGTLLGRMLSADCSKRPTAAEIVEALTGMTLEQYRAQPLKNRVLPWTVPIGTGAPLVLSVFGDTTEAAAHAMVDAMQRVSNGSTRRNLLIGAGAVMTVATFATLTKMFDVLSGECSPRAVNDIDYPSFNPFDRIRKRPEEGVEVSTGDGQPCVWMFRLSQSELQALGITMAGSNDVLCTLFYREHTSFLFVPGKGIHRLGSTTEENVRKLLESLPILDGPITIPPGFPGNEVSWRSTVNGRVRALQSEIREPVKK